MLRLVIAAGLVAAGVWFLLTGSPVLAVMDFLGAAFNVALYFMADRFGVILDPDGITLEGVTTRRYTWTQVYAIEPTKVFGDRRVRIDLMDGTSVRTWSPAHSWMAPDRDFDATVATMREYHLTRRREVARQVPPVSRVDPRGHPLQQPWSRPTR